jgi:penicillin-binding protein 1A
MSQPDGLENVRINRQTGLRASPDEDGAFFEVFRKENIPGSEDQSNQEGSGQDAPESPF